MYKNQKQNLFDIDNFFEKIRDKFKKKRIKIKFIDQRIEYDNLIKNTKFSIQIAFFIILI